MKVVDAPAARHLAKMIEPIDPWHTSQKILVILAHPDVPEFFCGATLARWALQGHEITYLLLTCGDKGFNPYTQPDMTPEKLCAIRHIEQANAAKVIGARPPHFLDLPDGYLPDWFEGFDKVLAMDWERMIPGHPYAGGRLGTKDDVRAAKQYMLDLSDAAKQLAADGRCLNDDAMRGVKLPKYESWGGYGTFLFGNVERFCEYWGRGY